MCDESISPHLRRQSQRPACDNRTSLSSSVILFPSYSLPSLSHCPSFVYSLTFLSPLRLANEKKTENQWCFCFMPTEVWNGNQSCWLKRAAKINVGEGGDGRGVWKGGWSGSKWCDRVVRDRGGLSCSPAGQCCSAIDFIWMMHSPNWVRHGHVGKELYAY